jgi:hypothetical protein
MRLKTLATAAAGLTLALGTVACNDDLTGINRSPNAPSSSDPQFLFPDGVTASVGRIRGANFDLTFTALWAQYYAKIQYVDEDWYQIRPSTIDTHWNQLYAGPLKDFQVAAQVATDSGKPEMAAPAIIMRDWTLGVMTDVWGDIPFTEALQASSEDPAFLPAYDPQAVVYDSILTSLASSAAALEGVASTGYGTADVIYGGDAAKWRKFANSLRARYGMRLSKVDPARAQAEVEAALAAGVMESNADNALLVWPGDGVNDNPYYTNFLGRDDHRVSKAMVDTLSNRNDPRLAVYAMPTADDPTKYVGIPNGLSTEDAIAYGLSKTSKPGAFFSQATSPSFLMTYSEVLLIKAEAAARGWAVSGGTAQSFYNEAIAASFEQFEVPNASAAAATYLAQPSVATATMDNIALQKWIALFGQGTEGWAEWRRTGVPVLTPAVLAITASGEVARRLNYPSIEQSLNNASLQAAIANQGGIDNTTIDGRVWWDTP